MVYHFSRRHILTSATTCGVLAMLLFTTTWVFIRSSESAGLTLGHAYGMNTTIGAWAKNLSTCISNRLDVPVVTVGAGALGGSRTIADAVLRGRIEFAVLPVQSLERFWKEMAEFSNAGIVYDPKKLITLSTNPELLSVLNKQGRRLDLDVVALGWQYGMMVSGYGDGRLTNLKGKTIAVRDDLTSRAIKKMGGKTVRISSGQALRALSGKVIDGAVFNEMFAKYALRKNVLRSVYWAEDFAPFARAMVVAMNTRKTGRLSDANWQVIDRGCNDASNQYNRQAFQAMKTLVADAETKGLRVFELPTASRNQWTKAHRHMQILSHRAELRTFLEKSAR